MRKPIPCVSLFCVLLLPTTLGVAGERIPKSAVSAIAEVRDAALRKDFDALRTTMVDEFVWSFGGDGDADQAISHWRDEPDALKALVRVTSGPCDPLEGAEDIIQCPADAGIDYRAGFKQTKDGWRMMWFVAGD